MRRSVKPSFPVCLLAFSIVIAPPAFAQPAPPKDLAEASLQELMNIQVTSVSKKEQSLSKTAAAVFVINREDIIRSGAISIPELLRLAPGVDVAWIDGDNSAVSIRGFNGLYSNKVLVLVDGRSVYSSIFSGVFWDQLDYPLDEIERIEVVRGPGASVWGANAVNGVINIITRSSETTHGGNVTVEGGSQERAAGTVQYGGALGSHGHYRAFAKYEDTGNAMLPSGVTAPDNWHGVHGGFRSDWFSLRNSLTVEGDVFDNRGIQTGRDALIPTPLFQTFTRPVTSDGGSLLTRWKHESTDGSDQSLQIYYSAFHRLQLGVPVGEKSFDLDYQNHRRLGTRHDLIWGLGYRVTNSHLKSDTWIQFNPASRSDNLYSAFVQDEIRLASALSLAVGSRFEHNSYTGFEFEPGVRLSWTPAAHTTLWAAASRGIRQPDREETSVAVDLGWIPLGQQTVGLVKAYGNPNLKTEELRDYEVGYRRQFGSRVALDLATYASFYRHLSSSQSLLPVLILSTPTPYLELPETFQNNAHAIDYGGELALNWNVTERWRIRPAYSMLHLNAQVNRGSPDTLGFNSLDSPEHMFYTRSLIDLQHRMTFDQTLSWTSNLGQEVPAYWRVDLRLAKRVRESGELSVGGQNLLRPGTLEFSRGFGIIATQHARSLFGRITWRF